MGALCQSLLYGYFQFPLQNGIWPMLAAMLLFVMALQGLSIFFICIAPSLRIALSIGGLFGVVSFSLTGFSFPAEAMYPAFHLLTDILPLRHYFIIYADQALNGVPFYYSRIYIFFWLYLSCLCSNEHCASKCTSPDFTTILQWKTDFSNR